MKVEKYSDIGKLNQSCIVINYTSTNRQFKRISTIKSFEYLIL